MAIIHTPIAVDTTKHCYFKSIEAKQKDYDSRFLDVKIFTNGIYVPIGMGCVVTINALRPKADGSGFENKSFAGSVNADGSVSVPVAYWIVENPGTVKCDITIFENEKIKLTSMDFEIVVRRSYYDSFGPSPDDPEYDIWMEIIAGIRQDIAEIRQDIVGINTGLVIPSRNTLTVTVKDVGGKKEASHSATEIYNHTQVDAEGKAGYAQFVYSEKVTDASGTHTENRVYDYEKCVEKQNGSKVVYFSKYSQDGVKVSNWDILVFDDKHIEYVESKFDLNDYTTKQETGVLRDRVDTLETDVDNLEVRATDLERRADAIEPRVDNLEDETEQLDERVDEVELTVFDTTTKDYNSRIVDVPVNSSKKATINRIEGHTEKCENLIPFPYYTNDFPYTDHGITYTLNPDGTITANGTCEEPQSILKIAGNLKVSGEVTLSGCPTGDSITFGRVTIQPKIDDAWGHYDYGTGSTFEVKNEITSMILQVTGGEVLKNAVFKPMLNIGSEAKPFQKYFEGLHNTKTISVKPKSKNMFAISDTKLPIDKHLGMDVHDGYFTIYGDGQTLQGATPITALNEPLDAGDYTIYITGDITGYKYQFYLKNEANTTLIDFTPATANIFTIAEPATKFLFYLNITAEELNKDTKIMIVSGHHSQSLNPLFEAGFSLPSLPIPAEVQALPGYGKEWTSMDFDNFVDDGVDIELDGTEEIEVYNFYGGNGVTIRSILDAPYDYAKGMCSNANVSASFDDAKNTMWLGRDTDHVIWLGILDILGYTADISGINQFKQYLRERKAAGNPVKIRYKSSVKHEVTPISQYFQGAGLPDVVVEAGGSIEFVNEHNQDMKTNITFTSDTVLLTEDDVDVEPTPDKIPRRTNAGEVKGVTTAESGTDILVNKGYAQGNFADKGKVDEMKKDVDYLLGQTTHFVEDATEAYIKDVPVGAAPHANVFEIGGRTYKSENLIPFPYVSTESVNTYGAKLSINNGVITVIGTPTKPITFEVFRNSQKPINATGTNIFSAGNPEHTAGYYELFYGNEKLAAYLDQETKLVDKNITEIRIIINNPNGGTLNIKPMLNSGTEAKPYEPYFSGLRDTKCTEVKSMGANLIPFPYVQMESNSNGVNWKANDDGSIVSQGTANGYSGLTLYDGAILFKKAIISIKSTTPYALLGVTLADARGELIASFEARTTDISGKLLDTSLYPNAKFMTIVVKRSNNNVDVSGTSYPMINIGTASVPFTKYIGQLDALPIPAEVQAQEDYGMGVGEFTNPIKFEGNKAKYVHNATKITAQLTGGINSKLEKTCSKYVGLKPNMPESPVNIISGLFGKQIGWSTEAQNKDVECFWAAGISYGYRLSYERLSKYTPNLSMDSPDSVLSEAFNTYFQNEPDMIVYALKESAITETDISQYFPNGGAVTVQGGGSVIFENKHKAPVPSRVGYQVSDKQPAPTNEGGTQQ